MLSLMLVVALAASGQQPTTGKQFIQSRSDTHAIAQMFAEDFQKLTPAQKALAWHLTMAAHAGEAIQYDQLGWQNVEVKRLLEGVYLFGLEGAPAGFEAQLTSFLQRFYGNTSNHDRDTGQKFLPAFSFDVLRGAAQKALAAGAPFPAKSAEELDGWLTELKPTLFDPAFEPQTTSKSPPAGQDIVTASSNTAYGKGVTLAEVDAFKEQNPLNSRVVEENGKLEELVFRAGGAGAKPGLYAEQLRRVNAHLAEAQKVADPKHRDALKKLVRYFQTGSLKDWDTYNIAWLRADPVVDANLGFIETYVDARGQKGQWEALVNFKNPAEQKVMALLGTKAQYFEDRMPWPEQYRRKKIAAPVAKAIDFVTAYPEPPAGINLPNEQHIRQKYGSKSVLIANVMETAAAVKRMPLNVAFSATAEERAAAEQYSVVARKLLVAFHEVTGHASGQADPKLKGNPSAYLKEYDNTLEEARADLVALWHAFDPALKELHADYEQIAEQMYRDFVAEGLTILAKVEQGDSFEEDHQRGQHMTVSYLIEKGAVKVTKVPQPDGKTFTYYQVTDFQKMRQVVGELLTMLMVIKATGDYEGIKALVNKYGVKFDPALRDEVVARVKAANVPATVFFASPRLSPVVDAKGKLGEVKIEHGQDFILQHLERAVLGELSPGDAAKLAAAGASREQLREAYRKLAPPPRTNPGEP